MQITVIIVTYQQEDVIMRAIESVLAQRTSHSYELLIGEDGGTDRTRAICQDYCDRYPDRVRLMPKAPNKGVARNYFDCVSAARGEFIAEMGGDDYWTDCHKLQKQADLLLKNPDASAVHTSWTISIGNRLIRPVAASLTESSDIVRAIATQRDIPVMHSCSWMYRKEIVANALAKCPDFFLDYCCEDVQTAYALAKAGRIIYMDDPTLCYQINEGTVSNSNVAIKQYDFVLSASRLFFRIIRKEGLHGADIDTFLQHKIYVLLMHLIHADRADKLPELLGYARQWQQSLSLRNRITMLALKSRLFRPLFVCLHGTLKSILQRKGGMNG